MRTDADLLMMLDIASEQVNNTRRKIQSRGLVSAQTAATNVQVMIDTRKQDFYFG